MRHTSSQRVVVMTKRMLWIVIADDSRPFLAVLEAVVDFLEPVRIFDSSNGIPKSMPCLRRFSMAFAVFHS